MKNKVFRRGFAAILAVLLCLSLFPVALAEGDPTIELSAVEAKPGDTVEVKVSLKNNPGIQSQWLTFEYDSAALELSAIELNATKLDAYVAAYNADTTNAGHDTALYPGEYLPIFYESELLKDESDKLIGFDWALLGYEDTAYAEDGDIATLKFTVKAEAAAGDLEIKVVANAENNFNEAGDITYTMTNGKITVKGEEPAGVKGDVNNDGVANTADAMLIARSVLSTTHARYKALTDEQKLVADVNGDGVVNTADAMLIARSVLSPTHPRYKALT